MDKKSRGAELSSTWRRNERKAIVLIPAGIVAAIAITEGF